MIGKIRVTSHGGAYEGGPKIHDLTLPGAQVGLTPVGNRLIVVPEERYEFGSLALTPGALAKELRFCVVVAVGPKVNATYPQLKPGVPVYIKPYFGTEIIVAGNPVVIIKPGDIIGLHRPKPPAGCLVGYAVFNRPVDFPDKYVVREQYIGSGKVDVAADVYGTYDTLEAARAAIPRGCDPIPRQPGDVLSLVELWL